MNKQPGQVKVTVETGYCPFCFRVRNLRHEERHLGTLVRTTITCESCHRTLSSTMGVAGEEPAPLPEQAEDVSAAAGQPEASVEPAAPASDAAKAAAKPKAKASAAKAQAPKSRSPRAG